MGEIQKLSKKNYFNNLIFYFKNRSDRKQFISFKESLGLYRNIRDGYTTLKKIEKSKKKKKKKKSQMQMK